MEKPSIDFDALVEVYFLEAPLGALPQKLVRGKPITSKVIMPNAFHTGVGFRIVQKGKESMEFACDLVANIFNLLVFLPQILPSGELAWYNQASVLCDKFIDRKYWMKSTIMCKIGRGTFYNLIDWIKNSFIPRNPTYVLMSTIKSASPRDIFNPINRSSTCDDFCYGVFKYLQKEEGIAIQYLTVPDYTVVGLVTTPENIIKLNMNDPEQRTAVINFYSHIERVLNDVMAYVAAGTGEAKRDALSKLECDLHTAIEDISDSVKIKIKNAIDKLEEDIGKITVAVNQNFPEKGSDLSEMQRAWNNLTRKPDAGALNNYLMAVRKYLVDSGVPEADISKLLEDANAFKNLVPLIMSSFKNMIYYGYTEDNTMAYYLIRGDKHLYANYIETDMSRDRPVLNLDGQLVSDIYTDVNMNRKLISNFYCEKLIGDRSAALKSTSDSKKVKKRLYIIVILFLVAAAVFLLFCILWRRKDKQV